MSIERIEPGPGQESVWDYPRPPRLEPVSKLLQVWFAGELIAETRAGHRMLETSHPPVYYLPLADLRRARLEPAGQRSTYCEFKGIAVYYDVVVDGQRAAPGAWGYPEAIDRYREIRDSVGFYAQAMDECRVGGDKVAAQAGGFYGGWITADIVGPFKGGPGTWGW